MSITVEHSTTEATAPEAAPCPAFNGTDGQHAHLQVLLNRYTQGLQMTTRVHGTPELTQDGVLSTFWSL